MPPVRKTIKKTADNAANFLMQIKDSINNKKVNKV